ncbi:YceI family protein [uncultured Roseivirga sp.]|uniref:YceI family protein n=1 Tax=uncultured Roseivirga sp. TaxID=543088 RepID=UPI0025874DCE|nr:YceI family protein [uncultured Roseivirga sp.]
MKSIVKTSFKILSLVALLLISTGMQAQKTVNLKPDAQEYVVKGTSTLHDWHMTSNEAKGFVTVSMIDGVPNFTGSEITLLAETLKSGKKGMDKNAYKALKTDEYESIEFVLNHCTMESAVLGKATAELTIAGFSRDVIFDIQVEQSGNAFTVKGTTDFHLTDFQIDPPTALMGTIKTGDEVTIEFKATFQN